MVEGELEISICKHCGKYSKKISTHHLIPRVLYIDSPTIEVCDSCHRKLEWKIRNFLMSGTFEAQKGWCNKSKKGAYYKKYRTVKQLSYFSLLKSGIKVGIYTSLQYNRRTNSFYIDNYWRGW